MSPLLAVLGLLAGSIGEPAFRPTPSPSNLPLRFEPTAEPGFDFEAIGANFRTFIRPGLLEMRFVGPQAVKSTRSKGRPIRSDVASHSPAPDTVVRMSLEGSNPAAILSGEAPFEGVSSYYLGSDPTKWRVGVPHYGRLRCGNVYPGVDLLLYGTASTSLEYDFVVAAGVDPAVIQLAFSGVETLQINQAGEIAWNIPSGRVQHHRPIIFQEIGGRKNYIQGGYRLRNAHTVAFEISGPYDRSLPLIIDPQVTFSSYAGHPTYDNAYAVAVDGANNTYMTGTEGDGVHVPYRLVIAKVNAAGTELVYWRVFGGTGNDVANALAVRPDGTVFVTGWTSSTNFPTLHPLQQQIQGTYDGFLLALTPDGILLYSTYLGGTGWDEGSAIAIGGSGDLYVLGESISANGFPGNPNPPAGSQDIFIARFRISGSPPSTEVRYVRFFGSASEELAGWTGLAIDAQENAYVVGTTRGDVDPSFPTSPNAAQEISAGEEEGFLVKFNPAGNIVYATLLGGESYDYAGSVAVDESGAAYVGGHTQSAIFPFTAGTPGPDKVLGGLQDNFILKVSPSGQAFEMFTFVGGSSWECIYCYRGPSVAVTADREVIFAGDTSSLDLPVTAGAPQTSNAGGVDALFGQLSPDGTAFQFLSYYGGIGTESAQDVALSPSTGIAHYTGFAEPGFPQVNAFQTYAGGGRDFFLTRLIYGPASELSILPTTTRWRPKWSDQEMVVRFAGPPDLVTGPASATLEIQGPDGLLAVPPLAIEPDGNDYLVRWTGPFTYVGGSPPQTHRLPARNYPIRIIAIAGGSPARTVRSNFYEKVSRVEVTSIVLNELPGGAPVDANPGLGNGLRVFSEAQQEPTDLIPAPPTLDIIRIDVAVEPPVFDPGSQGPVTVVLKSFDVDDPSPVEVIPGDDNQPCPPSGCDNILHSDPAAVPQRGLLSATGAIWSDGGIGLVIEAQGEASTAFLRTSRRQGDNYRVAGSTSGSWLDGLTPEQPSAVGKLVHGNGEPLPDNSQVSSMISVWRTLHLELDNIFAPDPPLIQPLLEYRNRFTEILEAEPLTLYDWSGPAELCPEDQTAGHDFENGWAGSDLRIAFQPTDDLHVFDVIGSNCNDLTVRLRPGQGNLLDGLTEQQIQALPDKTYIVRDDEVSSLAIPLQWHVAEAIFNSAYIHLSPSPQPPGESQYAFVRKKHRHITDVGTFLAEKYSTESYWSVQVVSGYEGEETKDLDPRVPPAGENGTFGHASAGPVLSPSSYKIKVIIFRETAHDLRVDHVVPPVMIDLPGPGPEVELVLSPDKEARTVAHELLHTFGLIHDGAIMCRGSLMDDPAGGTVTDAQYRAVRLAKQNILPPNGGYWCD